MVDQDSVINSKSYFFLRLSSMPFKLTKTQVEFQNLSLKKIK